MIIVVGMNTYWKATSFRYTLSGLLVVFRNTKHKILQALYLLPNQYDFIVSFVLFVVTFWLIYKESKKSTTVMFLHYTPTNQLQVKALLLYLCLCLCYSILSFSGNVKRRMRGRGTGRERQEGTINLWKGKCFLWACDAILTVILLPFCCWWTKTETTVYLVEAS